MSYDAGHEVPTTASTFTRGRRAEQARHPPVSAVFDVLADERRRHVLYYLLEDAGGEAGVADVATHLRSVESSSRTADPETIRTELHHRHLPRMEEAGLVDYDTPEARVRYLEDPLVEDCLALVAGRDFGPEP